MTIQEKTIEWLTLLKEKFIGTEYSIYLDAAIQALKQQPSEDCINREEAIKQCGFGMTSLLIADNLRRLPSVTPQPKTGRWIEEINDYGEITHWHCSNCYGDSGFTTTCKWDYCPNCGAKMEVEE